MGHKDAAPHFVPLGLGLLSSTGFPLLFLPSEKKNI